MWFGRKRRLSVQTCHSSAPGPQAPPLFLGLWSSVCLILAHLKKSSTSGCPRGLWVLWCHALSLSSVVLPTQAQGARVTLRWLQRQIWGGTHLSAWMTEPTFHHLSSILSPKWDNVSVKKVGGEGTFVFFFKYVLDNSESDECSHVLWTCWRPGDVVNHEKLQRMGPAVGWGKGSMISLSLSLSSHHFSKTVLWFAKESELNY